MQRDCHVFFYFGLVHSLIYPVVFRRTNINVHVVMDGYVDGIVMSCKLHAEQIYIFVGTKSENEFGTKTFQIALNINCDLVLFGVELQGVRGG